RVFNLQWVVTGSEHRRVRSNYCITLLQERRGYAMGAFKDCVRKELFLLILRRLAVGVEVRRVELPDLLLDYDVCDQRVSIGVLWKGIVERDQVVMVSVVVLKPFGVARIQRGQE